MGRRALLVGLLTPLLLAGGLAPDAAPKVAARSLLELPRPLPAPYRDPDGAEAAVTAALARAKAAHKPLLLVFGANWCADCRLLAGVFALPEMRAWVPKHFELVDVDVGEFDHNITLGKRFGARIVHAVPTVMVVDSATGRLRNAGKETELAQLPTRPQAAADWLARWQ